MRTIVTALFAASLLGGCQVWDQRIAEYAADHRLAPGDSVVLDTELVFPKGHARVKFQGDGPSGTRGIDEYHPYCELEVRTVSDGRFTLIPDRFTVTGFSEQILPFNTTGLPVRVAASVDDGSESQITYVSDIALHSDRQPEVMKLSCRHVVETDTRRFVSLDEMRDAVAGVLHFERAR